MIIYHFSPEKNLKLIEERSISFDVVFVRDYIYLVPFVTDFDGNIFLKIIIPSRKANKKYSREENEKKFEK